MYVTFKLLLYNFFDLKSLPSVKQKFEVNQGSTGLFNSIEFSDTNRSLYPCIIL